MTVLQGREQAVDVEKDRIPPVEPIVSVAAGDREVGRRRLRHPASDASVLAVAGPAAGVGRAVEVDCPLSFSSAQRKSWPAPARCAESMALSAII